MVFLSFSDFRTGDPATVRASPALFHPQHFPNRIQPGPPFEPGSQNRGEVPTESVLITPTGGIKKGVNVCQLGKECLDDKAPHLKSGPSYSSVN